MPRARPGARKTTARRRIRRYRTKWTHHVIPERIKKLLAEPPHHMLQEWEGPLKGNMPGYVECEEPTMAELEAKGVPDAEWPYYLGFMKRMLTLYRHYTGETLQLEKTSLIEEYVLRGYDRDVLEQVQEVAFECVALPPEPPPEAEFILQHAELWNFGPPSVMPLQHVEPWTPKAQPTFTLQHSEPWSS